MSFAGSSLQTPPWLYARLGVEPITEGESIIVQGGEYVLQQGILRERGVISESQTQTADAFGFKWHQRDTFESEESLTRMRTWLVERYGQVASAPWWSEYPSPPLVLDAGCGAAMSALELFGDTLSKVNYLGVDLGSGRRRRPAVRGARSSGRLSAGRHHPAAPRGGLGGRHLLRGSPTPHRLHSRRPQRAGGRPKARGPLPVLRLPAQGPRAEYTDDYIRARIQNMAPDEAWEALKTLSRLGESLGRLGVELTIPEDIELLGVPAGRYDLQRFFYWHVLKAFYRPDNTFDEMHHINYDWFAPANAHRQSPEEVRARCAEAHLEIEREDVQESGITIVARKRRD